jgi:hypothetical protein
LFGAVALQNFLVECNLKVIVRGHECVPEGIRVDFDSHCITVFSASNYVGRRQNQGAVLRLNEDKDESTVFPPIQFVLRGAAVFEPFPDPPEFARKVKASSKRGPDTGFDTPAVPESPPRIRPPALGAAVGQGKKIGGWVDPLPKKHVKLF